MYFELTFHWFEIELLAIPATLFYYYVAQKFFLLHRKKTSIGANIFVTSMRKKLATLANHFAETHDKMAARYSGDVSNQKSEDAISKNYFFCDKNSESDEDYDDLMYDEDQQNHLRNL